MNKSVPWATVILKPNFWWRLKYLFKPHDLVFCYSDRGWMSEGFTGQDFLSIAHVPTNMRRRLPPEDQIL